MPATVASPPAVTAAVDPVHDRSAERRSPRAARPRRPAAVAARADDGDDEPLCAPSGRLDVIA